MIKNATADPTFPKTLETALLADLRRLSVQGVNDTIHLAVHGADGGLLAGLTGTTSYGWLRVNMLWVDQSKRRAGIGKDLLEQSMAQCMSRGCHSAWLETSNPAAFAFYKALGFDVFATLANDGRLPADHTRWFLRRALELPDLDEGAR